MAVMLIPHRAPARTVHAPRSRRAASCGRCRRAHARFRRPGRDGVRRSGAVRPAPSPRTVRVVRVRGRLRGPLPASRAPARPEGRGTDILPPGRPKALHSLLIEVQRPADHTHGIRVAQVLGAPVALEADHREGSGGVAAQSSCPLNGGSPARFLGSTDRRNTRPPRVGDEGQKHSRGRPNGRRVPPEVKQRFLDLIQEGVSIREGGVRTRLVGRAAPPARGCAGASMPFCRGRRAWWLGSGWLPRRCRRWRTGRC